MITQTQKFASAYRHIERETGVPDASPHKLVLMLFDGALLAVSDARRHLAEKNIAEKGRQISRAIQIIAGGLDASLDKEQGGDLAVRLSSIYDYLCARLLHANLKNDAGALEEVNRLLSELRSAWEEIADDPAVVSYSRKTA
jgi:flagellar protein FliS